MVVNVEVAYMEADNRVTIAARVDRPFAEATTYFARKVNMTISTYAKTSILRRSTDFLKDRIEEFQTYTAVADLLRDAIKRGTWRELAEASPDVYPATLEGWKERAKEQAVLVEEMKKEIAEMDKQIEAMGTKVLM